MTEAATSLSLVVKQYLTSLNLGKKADMEMTNIVILSIFSEGN